MDYLGHANVFTIICAAYILYAVFRIHTITRSRGVFFLLAAAVWMLVARAVITWAVFTGRGDIVDISSLIVVGYWPLLAVGFYLLLKTLVTICKDNDCRGRDDDDVVE